jgi:ribosomal silencing factor RsfS
MDNISLVKTNKIDDKIQIIMRQTDYSEEKSREKLGEFKFDEMAVIRDYFGISEKKTTKHVTSVNQEIYKQLREHLDGAMRNYRERVEKGQVKKII